MKALKVIYTVVGLLAVLVGSLLLLSQYNIIDVYATANKDIIAKILASWVIIAGLFCIFTVNFLLKNNKN